MDGRLDVNVALNRPPIMSGQYSTYHGSYANDGDRNPDINGNSCAQTPLGQDEPWWAVDFGVMIYVLGVGCGPQSDGLRPRSEWAVDLGLGVMIYLLGVDGRPRSDDLRPRGQLHQQKRRRYR